MRLKPGGSTGSVPGSGGGRGAGFSDEIETETGQVRADLFQRGKGAGFSDEIETSPRRCAKARVNCVVRARGSQMRLKQITPPIHAEDVQGGKGAGFSDEIETARKRITILFSPTW